MKRRCPNECSSHLPPFTWASLEERPWILMRDDTVTPSERALFKDFCPCQKPPPPHAELSVWGGIRGWLRLISISKPLQCQLSEALHPPHPTPFVRMGFARLQGSKVNVCNVWGWHHPPWKSGVQTWMDMKNNTKTAWFLHLLFSLYVMVSLQKRSPVLFILKECLRLKGHPGRHSCAEYNLKFHHSVWSYIIWFPLDPDVIQMQ